jgi:hypothetical protein
MSLEEAAQILNVKPNSNKFEDLKKVSVLRAVRGGHGRLAWEKLAHWKSVESSFYTPHRHGNVTAANAQATQGVFLLFALVFALFLIVDCCSSVANCAREGRRLPSWAERSSPPLRAFNQPAACLNRPRHPTKTQYASQ